MADFDSITRFGRVHDLEPRESIQHFLRLAHSGRHSGASGGAKRACKLANAIVDDVPGLDQKAIDGLIEFINLAKSMPETARDMIEE